MPEADQRTLLYIAAAAGATRAPYTASAVHGPSAAPPIARIVELAPALFVMAAEASLQRRSEKLAELAGNWKFWF